MQEIRVEPTKSPKAKPASSDSLGFGGHNASLLFKKYEG